MNPPHPNTQRGHDIKKNAFSEDTRDYALRHIWAMKQLEPGCFDSAYYLGKNQDLPRWGDPMIAWHHYVMNGQFEGRPFRYGYFGFKCRCYSEQHTTSAAQQFRLLCKRLLEYDPTNPMIPMIMEEVAEAQAAQESAQEQQATPAADEQQLPVVQQEPRLLGPPPPPGSADNEQEVITALPAADIVEHGGTVSDLSDENRPFGGEAAPMLDWETVANALVAEETQQAVEETQQPPLEEAQTNLEAAAQGAAA